MRANETTINSNIRLPLLKTLSTRILTDLLSSENRKRSTAMRVLIIFLVCFIRNRFRTAAEIEAENLALRHQLNVALRKAPKIRLRGMDRALFVFLYRLIPSVLNAIAIVKPETVIRWHRDGFRSWWRRKSRHRGGRPRIGKHV